MVTTLFVVFISALLIGFLGKFIPRAMYAVVSIIPLGVFLYFLKYVSQISESEAVVESRAWVPSLNVHLDFYLDGLSLLFALIISGIGFLVFFYTAQYLKNHPYIHRFYGYLIVFMGSMLGLVLADNLILLFIFWELTSISSFFLIGFNNEDSRSRKSALIALAVTAIGGLFLLISILVMGYAGESFSIKELLQGTVVFADHPAYYIIVICLFLAAFTKSAQFPFHFWLPGAMDAPTPVSTYLHSATMVKAGVFILLRFSAVLGATPFWTTTLIAVGAITMIYAGIQIFYKTDLKNILAYSTIAALGTLVFLTGIGSREAILAAVFFILIHALYKAALFLVVGIIDYSTGSRDVTKLYGLAKYLLPTAIAAAIAAISNAGIPPSFGFVGKDLAYAATLLPKGYTAILLTTIAIISNSILFYAGYLVGIKPFFKKKPAFAMVTNVEKVSWVLWLPPMILSAGSLIFGLFPQFVNETILHGAYAGVTKATALTFVHLWPGFNLILLLSAVTIAAGIALSYFVKPSKEKEFFANSMEPWSPKGWFENASKGYFSISKTITNTLQNGNMRSYIRTITIIAILLLAYALRFKWSYNIHDELTDIGLIEFIVLMVLLLAIIKSVYTRSRITAVISMAVVGYSICLTYVYYSAPDLAMTQFSIDTLTVVMFVLILHKLPKYVDPPASIQSRWRDGVLSGIFGLLIMWIGLEVLQSPKGQDISNFYSENAFLLAKGKNVVNVILVDFRGFDTFMEITVLTIAAVGVFSLTRLQITKDYKY